MADNLIYVGDKKLTPSQAREQVDTFVDNKTAKRKEVKRLEKSSEKARVDAETKLKKEVAEKLGIKPTDVRIGDGWGITYRFTSVVGYSSDREDVDDVNNVITLSVKLPCPEDYLQVQKDLVQAQTEFNTFVDEYEELKDKLMLYAAVTALGKSE